jgi:hypothetical protein
MSCYTRCTKCEHIAIVSITALKSGHRCTKCGNGEFEIAFGAPTPTDKCGHDHTLVCELCDPDV